MWVWLERGASGVGKEVDMEKPRDKWGYFSVETPLLYECEDGGGFHHLQIIHEARIQSAVINPCRGKKTTVSPPTARPVLRQLVMIKHSKCMARQRRI